MKYIAVFATCLLGLMISAGQSIAEGYAAAPADYSLCPGFFLSFLSGVSKLFFVFVVAMVAMSIMGTIIFFFSEFLVPQFFRLFESTAFDNDEENFDRNDAHAKDKQKVAGERDIARIVDCNVCPYCHSSIRGQSDDAADYNQQHG